MQAAVSGHLTFFKGSYESKKDKKEVPYYAAYITEKGDRGVKLVKVSVGSDQVALVEPHDGKNVQILADMIETNYNGEKSHKLSLLKITVTKEQ